LIVELRPPVLSPAGERRAPAVQGRIPPASNLLERGICCGLIDTEEGSMTKPDRPDKQRPMPDREEQIREGWIKQVEEPKQQNRPTGLPPKKKDDSK
jgi:hypothetical protein